MIKTSHFAKPRKVVIIGEHNPAWETHRFTNAALAHAQHALSVENPAFVPRLQFGTLRVSGSDATGKIRVVEYANHPFLIGTLFVPQCIPSREILSR